MTAAPPPRDSVLDALGYAFRVLGKPAFLWAPILLYVILAAAAAGPAGPELGLRPHSPHRPNSRPTSGPSSRCSSATFILGIVLGPVASAVIYRLARQYVDGEPPGSVRAGDRGISRGGSSCRAWCCSVLVHRVPARMRHSHRRSCRRSPALALAILLTVIGGFVVYLLAGLRIGLAPVLLLSGAGPVESIGRVLGDDAGAISGASFAGCSSAA